MLEVLWNKPILKRQQSISMGLLHPITLAYVSDLHCTPWSQTMLTQLAIELEADRPDYLILGGDLLDLPCGHQTLANWVERLQKTCQVLAVPGNHDHWVGLKKIKRKLNKVQWLDEASLTLPCGLQLCGKVEQKVTDKSLLVGHQPTLVRQAAQAGFPLMLAGHLHGCQWIWFHSKGYDYPGAWFYAFHGPCFQIGPTLVLVSRGISDTVPLRIACPRDYLRIKIT